MVKYNVSKKRTFIKTLLKKDLNKVYKNPKKILKLKTNINNYIWQFINDKSKKMIDVSHLLVQLLTFFFIMYFIIISMFFFIRNYLTTFTFVTLTSLILFFIFSILIYLFPLIVFKQNTLYLSLDGTINLLSSISNQLSFSLNYLSYFFFLLVSIIGCATNIYTLNYFRGESDEGKFLFWLNSFIFSMIIFVLGNNFFTLFLGWELIGLTSFFLINFWTTRKATLKSSIKAFTFNLASDIFFLIALVSFYKLTNTTDCDAFVYTILWEGFTDNSLFNLGIISLILACSIKSVQIGGHLWLPDSMEAPVPASALIHSATLVSAGIFLICKFNILFLYFEYTNFLTFIGALTAAYGGVVAASQTDMKKLLAYSTMSHCGFLWILASNNYFEVTIIYLFLHGLFKAATFYCAGSFIRFYESQDTRLMGCGGSYLLGDSVLLIFCSMNLAGLPFTIGVTYKNLFLKIFITGTFDFLTVGLIFVGLLSGLVYFFRLVYYSVFDLYKGIRVNPTSILISSSFITNNILRIIKFNHVLAVSLLIITSLIVSVVGNWFVGTNIINFFNYLHNTDYINLYIINKYFFYKIYAVYYIYFYALYTFVFMCLVIFSWRKNYFSIELIILIIYILVSLVFIF